MVLEAVLSAALIAPCTTTDRHDRWMAKNRPAPQASTVEEVSVADMLAWPVPFVRGWARVKDIVVPGEGQVVRITAYVRAIKLSLDDCDVHVELADDRASTGPRAIIEIPVTQPAARTQLAAIVGGTVSGKTRRLGGPASPRIRATCWRFVDLSHQGKAPSKSGHGHGSQFVKSLWEGHPCFTIERADGNF